MPKSYGLASVTAPQGHPPAPEDAACDFTSEEVSALVCQQKCVVEGCKFFCVEKTVSDCRWHGAYTPLRCAQGHAY